MWSDTGHGFRGRFERSQNQPHKDALDDRIVSVDLSIPSWHGLVKYSVAGAPIPSNLLAGVRSVDSPTFSAHIPTVIVEDYQLGPPGSGVYATDSTIYISVSGTITISAFTPPTGENFMGNPKFRQGSIRGRLDTKLADTKNPASVVYLTGSWSCRLEYQTYQHGEQ